MLITDVGLSAFFSPPGKVNFSSRLLILVFLVCFDGICDVSFNEGLGVYKAIITLPDTGINL